MRGGAAAAATLLLVLSLGGCQSGSGTTAELTGLAAGGAAGGITANPAIGYAVAIGTAAGADAALKWYGRSRRHSEQEAIAGVAAALSTGDAAPWQIRHLIPYGNEHGQVRVVRVIDTPLVQCREIVFSVEDAPKPPAWYATSICHADSGWHWAEAEPAVERWGYLQQAIP